MRGGAYGPYDSWDDRQAAWDALGEANEARIDDQLDQAEDLLDEELSRLRWKDRERREVQAALNRFLAEWDDLDVEGSLGSHPVYEDLFDEVAFLRDLIEP